MSTGLKPLDATIHLTNVWLHDVMEALGWSHRERAYHALRAVFHALRDQLSPEGAASLGAQLPLLLRGMYYEGWHLGRTSPVRPKRQTFLAAVGAAFQDDRDVEPETVVRAVLGVVAQHVSRGEVEDLKRLLPGDFADLWP